jgi:2-hydroxycyclohexanecarboxyl-CoA dehydrogenase
MTRTAFVSGGASGIGLGIATRLAQAGHRVAILDVQKDAVRQVENERGVLGLIADVSDRRAVDDAVAAAREQLGPIEVLITAAGIDLDAAFVDIAGSDWDRALAVNLSGTFHCIQSAVGDMLAAGWGRIITISSSSAQSGAANRAHYVASKGGVIALTKALAVEFAPHGITVNTIPPSIIDTPMVHAAQEEGRISLKAVAKMTPVRRAGTPEDVAAACEFLCSEDAGFITGQQIGVNGGWYL